MTDPTYDEGATADIGAVYLYDGATLALISTLKGVTASDQVGNLTIIVLTGGNHFVVVSRFWDNPSPATADVGAVTLCSQTTGCSGTVSAANSLIGASVSDNVGSAGITVLANGNYVVRSTSWDNTSPAADVGAVTFCSGMTGCTGAVSASNSLVGSTAGDFVGSRFAVLTNGNYVVGSDIWDGAAGPIVNARFALYGNGATGTFGSPTDAANNDRTVPGTVAAGVTAAPRFEAVNNQMLVQRSASNTVTVLRFVTTTTTALTNGNWEDSATWSNGVPSLTNHPIIPAGWTVTLNSGAIVQNLTVQTGGNLIFNADLTVNGTLSIGAILSTGANVMTLGCEASVSGAGANSFIAGNLKKDFCDISAFTYPVGTTTNGNEYSPVTATVTDGLFDDFPGLTVRAVKGNRAGMNSAESAQRYFALTEDGDLTADLVFSYTDDDVNGTEADYKLFRFDGATSNLIPSTLSAGMNTISAGASPIFPIGQSATSSKPTPRRPSRRRRASQNRSAPSLRTRLSPPRATRKTARASSSMWRRRTLQTA